MSERPDLQPTRAQGQVEPLAWIGPTETDDLEREALERFLAERALTG